MKHAFFALILAFNFSLQATNLKIKTLHGEKIFHAEIALSPQEHMRGLMFRTDLKSDEGMLFVMNPATTTSMWMKNTPLSLDMLFINPQGKIAHIEKFTTPYSLRIIGPHRNIAYVFEVLGGTCEIHDIREGDSLILQ